MNFQEIIDAESQMMADAKNKYGEFFDTSFESLAFLQEFISDAKMDSWLFMIMLSHIRKHTALAFFSIIRRHHIQGFMDLRQVLEGLSIDLYALAHTDLENLAKIDENNIIQEVLNNKHYTWLNSNYPEISQIIKTTKGQINDTCSHANLTYAVQDFKLTKKTFEFSFFDRDDLDLVKGDLWFVGYICMHTMAMIFTINKDYKLINITDESLKQVKELEVKLNKLKNEMLKKEKFNKYLPILS